MDLEKIIRGCKQQKAKAQKELYNGYKDILYGICRRYVKSKEDAEDVFVEGFYKIYNKIDSYKGKGSFEGWMKRIMINESLMFLRKNKHFHLSIESDNVQVKLEPSIVDQLQYNDVLKLLDLLPVG